MWNGRYASSSDDFESKLADKIRESALGQQNVRMLCHLISVLSLFGVYHLAMRWRKTARNAFQEVSMRAGVLSEMRVALSDGILSASFG